MDEVILQTIKDIEARKQAEHKAPTHALRREIFQEVNAALNRLYTSGRITTGDTIQDKWIHAID